VHLALISSFNTSVRKFIAAKPLIKKSVFCVDNVDKSVTVEDLRSFVADMAINVVSCFETKPRRRRFDTAACDHKAFRLCIASDDRNQLLDASKWPAYISVSEWFFKSSTQKSTQSTSSASDRLPTVRTDQDGDGFGTFDDDMEATIIMVNPPNNDQPTLNNTNGV